MLGADRYSLHCSIFISLQILESFDAGCFILFLIFAFFPVILSFFKYWLLGCCVCVYDVYNNVNVNVNWGWFSLESQ